MRRKRNWVLPLLILALVIGCTGTVEDPIETLLVVGFADGNQGRLALIENNVLRQTATEPLRWLPESVRDLPGLPLAADVIDRTRDRTALVVLSRDSAGISYLSTFNLRNLALDQLDGFVETARIVLNDPDAPLLPVRPGQVLCPTRLQVSSDGDFAAMLNQPTACGATGDIFITLLELTPPRFVRHYEGLFRLVDNALVLDQAADDDTLHFLEESGNRVQLKSLALDRLAERPVIVGEARIEARDVQDMGIVRDSMVVLGRSNFAAFDNFRVDPDEPTVINTTANSLRLITSDFADIAQVMVLGRDHFTVHLSTTEPANRADLRGYQSGTVEALNGLVFLVREGEIRVFDLLRYAGGTPELTTPPIPLSELTAPAFLSWVALAPTIP